MIDRPTSSYEFLEFNRDKDKDMDMDRDNDSDRERVSIQLLRYYALIERNTGSDAIAMAIQHSQALAQIQTRLLYLPLSQDIYHRTVLYCTVVYSCTDKKKVTNEETKKSMKSGERERLR